MYNIRSRIEKKIYLIWNYYIVCFTYAFNCVKFGISFLFAKRVFFSKKNIYLLLFEWKGNFLKCDWHWRVKVVPAEFVDVWEREMRNNNRLTFANFVRSFVVVEDFKIVVKDDDERVPMSSKQQNTEFLWKKNRSKLKTLTIRNFYDVVGKIVGSWNCSKRKKCVIWKSVLESK